MPTPTRLRRRPNPAEDKEKAEDAKKKVFDEFYSVQYDIIQLTWDWKRALGKNDLIESKRGKLRKALLLLWDIQAPREKANEAHEALNKTKRLEDIFKDIKKSDDAANEYMEDDFGTGETGSSGCGPPDSKLDEYLKIRQFSESTNYMLKLESIPNVTRALSYWEAAFEKQRTIMNVYKQIPAFSKESHDLYEDISKQSDVSTVKDRTQRLKEILGESNNLLKKGSETIKGANKELRKIFRDMDDFWKDVGSAERKRERKARKVGSS